ncbi:glycosyltransferase family 4 protein [Patescibacteria group bacterium]
MKNVKAKICYISSVDVTIKFILFNQIKFLKREGHNVHVVCSFRKWKKNIEKEGIKTKNMGFKRRITPISDLIILIRLFFYLKKEKFDIVHTHTPKASLLGQLAAKMAGVPIIVNTVHGFYFQKRDSWKKRIFFISIEKIAAKCSDLIFFVNREDMETAVKEKICPPEIRKYFGGAVDMKRFDPEKFSNEFILSRKKQLGINPNNKIVGIVSRFVGEKGYLDLFPAFKKILKDLPKTTLLIIGALDKEKKDSINPKIVKKYNIEKNVIFLGERSDVDVMYSLIDVFVLPSYREGLGISIIEASSMKKPVVATDIRGCREAVDGGKTGLLVPIKNPEKLAKAIMWLFKNPKKAKEMGERGREKIQREFDENIIFSRINTEYQRLLREKLE